MRNIRSKIMNVLEDGQTLSKYELLARLERLVTEEVEFSRAEHSVGLYELNVIKAQAVKVFTEIDPRNFQSYGYGDSDEARTWCYVDSVISLLRSMGLINFTLKYDRKRKG